MAGKNSNTTDKLVIDIKVNVKKGASTQITNLTKSLTKLNEAVKNTANIEKYANALRTIGKELTRTTSNKGVAKLQGNADLLETTDVDVKDKIKNADKQEINDKKEKIRLSKEERLEAKKLKKEQKNIERANSFFDKFGRSIGRIAMYRAIRSLLSGVVKAAKEGLQLFSQYDEVTNKSMSNIVNSSNQIKATLGVSLGNIINTLSPVIVTLSDAVVGFLDGINKAIAVLSGQNSYKKAIKQNEDYAESLKKVNEQLLSFDKFESLQKNVEGVSPEDTFETVLITDEEKASIEHIYFVLGEIGALLVAFASYKIIQWIQDGGIKKLVDGLKSVKGKVDDISTAGLIASSAFVFVSSIVNLIDVIKNWDSQSLITKITAITSAVLGLAAVIFAILAAIPAIGHATVFKAISIGLAAGAALSVGVSAMRFADGGMVPSEKGTTFIAGEAGAEVVHTSARGTGVTNIEQFSQAMLQALATYGVARGSDVSFKGDVYIDRTKAGQLLEGSVYGEGVRVGHFKRV